MTQQSDCGPGLYVHPSHENHLQGNCVVHLKQRQERVAPDNEKKTITRKSSQRGYVSDPIRNRYGTAFVIRYRLRTAGREVEAADPKPFMACRERRRPERF